MAGAVGAAARGAMEAGERGGAAVSRFSRGAGRDRGPCGFSQGEGGGRGGLWWVYQPPYFSEFNPAEGVSEEVRRWVEGRRYERIEAKKAAVEWGARGLEAGGKVSSLVGGPYIHQALNAPRSWAFRNGIREASTRKLL
jgi:hypothetical protein